MKPGQYDLDIWQGQTFTQEIVWKDSIGTPVDLTNYTARMQVRKKVKSSTTEIELTTANGRISLGTTNGTITLTISATDTASLDFTCAVYDLELESQTSVVTRVLEGSVTLHPEVTR